MRWSFLPTLAVFLLAWPSRAAPSLTSVSLSYLPDAHGAQCPSEAFFRSQLASRFGYDPFDEPTPRRHLAVKITRRDGKYEVRGEITNDDDGKVSFKYQAPAAFSCKQAVTVMGLAVAAELTTAPLPEPAAPPVMIVVEGPPAPARPPPKQEPSSLLADASARPMPAAARPRVQVGAGSFLAINNTPSPTAGFMLSLGARWPSFSIAIEGQALVPRSLEVTSETGKAAQVRTMLLAFAGAPCAHFSYFLGCGLVALGQHQVRVSDNLEAKTDATALYVAAGVRAGVELPLADRFALRGYADLLGAKEPTLVVKKQTVWAPVPLAGAVAISATASF